MIKIFIESEGERRRRKKSKSTDKKEQPTKSARTVK